MNFITQECAHERCAAEVVAVNITSGVPAAKSRDFIDPKPVQWADGGRLRLSGHQPHAAEGRYNVALVRVNAAFGVNLYRLHSAGCLGKLQAGRSARR